MVVDGGRSQRVGRSLAYRLFSALHPSVCPMLVSAPLLRASRVLSNVSTRSVPPCLRVLSNFSAQSVPPSLSAVHRPLSVSAPFLRSSVLSTLRVLSTATVHRKCPLGSSAPQRCPPQLSTVSARWVPPCLGAVHRRCPQQVPAALLRASERCPPPLHHKCPLRSSVPQSAVNRKCPVRSSVPQSAAHLSARSVSLCLRALSTVSARCVPPCLRALSSVSARAVSLRASERRPPSVPAAFLRPSVLAAFLLVSGHSFLFLVLVVGWETLSMVRFLGSELSHDTRATISLFLNCSLVLVVGRCSHQA